MHFKSTMRVAYIGLQFKVLSGVGAEQTLHTCVPQVTTRGEAEINQEGKTALVSLLLTTLSKGLSMNVQPN